MNIVRIEQGNSRGYQLKWAGGSKWFSARKYGSMENAHAAAQAMQSTGRRRLADAKAHAEVKPRGLYKTNSSGVKNAGMVWRKVSGGNEFLYAQGRYKGHAGRWIATSFSVHRWGVEEAILRALAVHQLSTGDLAVAVAKLTQQARRMMRDVKAEPEQKARRMAARG